MVTVVPPGSVAATANAIAVKAIEKK